MKRRIVQESAGQELIDFCKPIIEKHLKDGFYEYEIPHEERGNASEDQIRRLFDIVKQHNVSLEDAAEEILSESLSDPDEEYGVFIELVSDEIADELDEYDDEGLIDEFEEVGIYDVLESCGYAGIRVINALDYFPSEIDVDIGFATPKEENEEYATIPSRYNPDNAEYRNDADADNMLVKFLKSQGLVEEELLDCLDNETPPKDNTLRSVYDEIRNQTNYTGLLSLGTRISLEDYAKLYTGKWTKITVYSTPNSYFGIYCPGEGGGSLMGIEFTKPFVVTDKSCLSFAVLSGKGYSILNVYGDPAFKDNSIEVE